MNETVFNVDVATILSALDIAERVSSMQAMSALNNDKRAIMLLERSTKFRHARLEIESLMST